MAQRRRRNSGRLPFMSRTLINTPHRFLIFRHGIATHSTAGYGDQVLTAGLLPEAYPVIERLAKHLASIRSQLNFSSEILRCRQTAEIVTKHTGKFFRFDPRLNEYHGETFEQFATRVRSVLEDLVSDADDIARKKNLPHGSATLMICTHGAVIAAIKHFLLEDHFLQKDELDYTTPGQLMDVHGSDVSLLDFN